jgi:hypothetical protein
MLSVGMKLRAHPGKADTIHINCPSNRTPPLCKTRKGNGIANNDTLLTGNDLQFMDQLETDLEEGGSSEAVGLRARLKVQAPAGGFAGSLCPFAYPVDAGGGWRGLVVSHAEKRGLDRGFSAGNCAKICLDST